MGTEGAAGYARGHLGCRSPQQPRPRKLWCGLRGNRVFAEVIGGWFVLEPRGLIHGLVFGKRAMGTRAQGGRHGVEAEVGVVRP